MKAVSIRPQPIAHDLHVEGIPWVFASQFPLTVPGSVRMAETLYPRLFRGDDPRQILFEMRRQLYQTSQGDHDWASLIVYATLPSDFNNRVSDFSFRQIKDAIAVLLDHADSIADLSASPPAPGGSAQGGDEAKIAAEGAAEGLLRGEILGTHGSTYKRIALLLARVQKDQAKVRSYYDKARDYYRQTMEEAGATNMHYYWSGTQFLALHAIMEGGERSPEIYSLVHSLADRDTKVKVDDSTRAWAHATLAELELLGTFHRLKTSDPPLSKDELNRIIESVKEHCKEVVKLMGPKSFHVGSTWRQFKRYYDSWSNPRWKEIAESAMDALNPGRGGQIWILLIRTTIDRPTGRGAYDDAERQNNARAGRPDLPRFRESE